MPAERMVGGHGDEPVRRDFLQAFDLEGDVHVFKGFFREFDAGVSLLEAFVQEILVQELPAQPDEPTGRLFPQLAAEKGAYVDQVFVRRFHWLCKSNHLGGKTQKNTENSL
jgi:hypothetical protein